MPNKIFENKLAATLATIGGGFWPPDETVYDPSAEQVEG